MPTPAHLTRIDVFWTTASGEQRVTTHEMPRGAEDWTANDWLACLCVGPRVHESWTRIEATRELDGLRVRLQR